MNTSEIKTLKSIIKAAKATEIPLKAASTAAWNAHNAAVTAFLAADPEPKQEFAFDLNWRRNYDRWVKLPSVIAWKARHEAAVTPSHQAAVDASNALRSAEGDRLQLQDRLLVLQSLDKREAGVALDPKKVVAVVEVTPGQFKLVRSSIASGRYVAAEVTSTGAVTRAIGPTGSRVPSDHGNRVLPVIELPR